MSNAGSGANSLRSASDGRASGSQRAASGSGKQSTAGAGTGNTPRGTAVSAAGSGASGASRGTAASGTGNTPRGTATSAAGSAAGSAAKSAAGGTSRGTGASATGTGTSAENASAGPRGTTATTTSALGETVPPPPFPIDGPPIPAPRHGRIRDPLIEDLCQKWEKFALDVARAVAMGEPLPTPPGHAKGVPREIGRVTEAALSSLAALWSSDADARYLRRQLAEIKGAANLAADGDDPSATGNKEADPAITSALWRERQETFKLMKRDVMLTEKVAATRSELFRMRQRDAEQAEAHVGAKAEVFEARERAARMQETNRERDSMLVRLRRQAEELTRRLELNNEEYEMTSLALKESELRCHRLRRELYDSETERKRVMDTVRQVLGRVDSRAQQQLLGSADGLESAVGSRSAPNLASSAPASSGGAARTPSPDWHGDGANRSRSGSPAAPASRSTARAATTVKVTEAKLAFGDAGTAKARSGSVPREVASTRPGASRVAASSNSPRAPPRGAAPSASTALAAPSKAAPKATVFNFGKAVAASKTSGATPKR